MNAHLLTFISATASKDLWAVLGVLVAIALAVFAWVRREERREQETLDAQESVDVNDHGPQPGPVGN